MENLEQGSDLPLEQHLDDVNGALEKLMENQNVPAAFRNEGAQNNAMIDAVIAAASPLKGVSLFVALADGFGGGGNGNHMKESTNSIFVNAHQQMMQQMRPKPTPLVPLSYKEKAALAKGGAKPGKNPLDRSFSAFAMERLALAADSVTGGSMADKKKTPMKGVKITPEVAAALGSPLALELSNTLKEMDGTKRWENNPKRLEEEARKGSQPAKKFAQTRTNYAPQKPGGDYQVTAA